MKRIDGQWNDEESECELIGVGKVYRQHEMD